MILSYSFKLIDCEQAAFSHQRALIAWHQPMAPASSQKPCGSLDNCFPKTLAFLCMFLMLFVFNEVFIQSGVSPLKKSVPFINRLFSDPALPSSIGFCISKNVLLFSYSICLHFSYALIVHSFGQCFSSPPGLHFPEDHTCFACRSTQSYAWHVMAVLCKCTTCSQLPLLGVSR